MSDNSLSDLIGDYIYETGRDGAVYEINLPNFDNDQGYKVPTKLEVISRDIRVQNGQMYATLDFYVKVKDEDGEYRNIYKTSVKNVLLYDIKVNPKDNSGNLGGLERLISHYDRIGEDIGRKYYNFLTDEGTDYNEIDEDDKDSYLHDLDEEDVPLVFPMYFTDLVLNLSYYLVNKYASDIQRSS